MLPTGTVVSPTDSSYGSGTLPAGRLSSAGSTLTGPVGVWRDRHCGMERATTDSWTSLMVALKGDWRRRSLTGRSMNPYPPGGPAYCLAPWPVVKSRMLRPAQPIGAAVRNGQFCWRQYAMGADAPTRAGIPSVGLGEPLGGAVGRVYATCRSMIPAATLMVSLPSMTPSRFRSTPLSSTSVGTFEPTVLSPRSMFGST